jgi:hypothetical protein
LLRFFSTRLAQAVQVIPSISSSWRLVLGIEGGEFLGGVTGGGNCLRKLVIGQTALLNGRNALGVIYLHVCNSSKATELLGDRHGAVTAGHALNLNLDLAQFVSSICCFCF